MFDESSGWETDPGTVLFNLRGLPVFPKSDELPDTQSRDAAFAFASGPTSLLQEVLMLPPAEPQAPADVYLLLDEARLCHSSGQYEAALSKLNSARLVWEDKGAWAILRAGLDPIAVRAKAARRVRLDQEAEQRRQREEAARREQARLDFEAAEVKRKKKEEEARVMGHLAFLMNADDDDDDAANNNADGSGDGNGSGGDGNGNGSRANLHSTRHGSARHSAAPSPRSAGSAAATPHGSGHEISDLELASERQAVALAATVAATTVEAETEFYVYLYSSVGAVYHSRGDYASALVYHWRARCVGDRYAAFTVQNPGLRGVRQPAEVYAHSLMAAFATATAASAANTPYGGHSAGAYGDTGGRDAALLASVTSPVLNHAFPPAVSAAGGASIGAAGALSPMAADSFATVDVSAYPGAAPTAPVPSGRYYNTPIITNSNSSSSASRRSGSGNSSTVAAAAAAAAAATLGALGGVTTLNSGSSGNGGKQQQQRPQRFAVSAGAAAQGLIVDIEDIAYINNSDDTRASSSASASANASGEASSGGSAAAASPCYDYYDDVDVTDDDEDCPSDPRNPALAASAAMQRDSMPHLTAQAHTLAQKAAAAAAVAAASAAAAAQAAAAAPHTTYNTNTNSDDAAAAVAAAGFFGPGSAAGAGGANAAAMYSTNGSSDAYSMQLGLEAHRAASIGTGAGAGLGQRNKVAGLRLAANNEAAAAAAAAAAEAQARLLALRPGAAADLVHLPPITANTVNGGGNGGGAAGFLGASMGGLSLSVPNNAANVSAGTSAAAAAAAAVTHNTGRSALAAAALARSKLSSISDYIAWLGGQSPLSRPALRPVDPLSGASPVAAMVLNNIGLACTHLGELVLALSCFHAALQVRFLCVPENSAEYADVAVSLNNIAACLDRLARYNEARAYLSAAAEVLAPRLVTTHPRVTTVALNLERVTPKSARVRVDISQLQAMAGLAVRQGQAWAVAATAASGGVAPSAMPPHLVKAKPMQLHLTVYQQMLLESQNAPKKKPAPPPAPKQGYGSR